MNSVSPGKKTKPKAVKATRKAAASGRYVNERSAASGARAATHPRSGKVVKKRQAVNKVRKTVTLDANVLLELESRDGSVSAQVNEFVIQGLEWERRREQIFELVAEYEAEFGVISEDEVEEWEQILA